MPPPLVWLISTMNPGRLSVSAPRPYSSHDPMLGRPLSCDPLFMNAWAGSWLICSVTIDRMIAMSSAILAACGNSDEISCPLLPYLANSTNGPRASSVWFWSWASCCPLVNDSGNGLPCRAARAGL
jgi:hypothetical protein